MLRPLTLGLCLASPALAQDTAGAWAPTFTARHAGWDVTCDARVDEERCYIRYIDIYSPRPNFGVVFFFLEITNGAPTISLGREFETDLVADTLRVRPGWDRAAGTCRGGPCVITGERAARMARALSDGGTLEIGFVDATATPQLRAWDSDGFAAAFADVTREAAARGL